MKDETAKLALPLVEVFRVFKRTKKKKKRRQKKAEKIRLRYLNNNLEATFAGTYSFMKDVFQTKTIYFFFDAAFSFSTSASVNIISKQVKKKTEQEIENEIIIQDFQTSLSLRDVHKNVRVCKNREYYR